MNKKYKITLSILLILPIFLTITRDVKGSTEYTKEEVAQHNTSDDCWMTFNNNVYDFTTTLNWHRKYQDITPWCGQDMTIAFKTKDGTGEDHKPSSYTMLADYLLGTFLLQGTVTEDIAINTSETITDTTDNNSLITSDSKDSESNNNEITVLASVKDQKVKKYNILIPVIISILLYVGFYTISKSKLGKVNKLLSIHSFNLFWNTVLLLSLIPAFGFGIFMVIQIQKPALQKIVFDFLYWHVELSFVMGTVAIMHFIQRWKQFVMPYKMLFRKKKSN